MQFADVACALKTQTAIRKQKEAIIKNVLGKTQAEVKEKLKKAIEENVGIDSFYKYDLR